LFFTLFIKLVNEGYAYKEMYSFFSLFGALHWCIDRTISQCLMHR